MRLPTRLLALALFVAAPAYAQSTAASVPTSTSLAAPTLSILTPDSMRVSMDSAATATATSSAPASEMTTTGASLTGLRVGVHTRESARAGITAPTNANLGQARAMMIVGVGGLIAGAIVGGTPGTIIMVGGVVVGLIGLYDYLQ
ncbi:MAG TPA: hypothetical protein VGM50_17120 [Gemmatimonadaceae bacterium]|jgi:hypothetical protein